MNKKFQSSFFFKYCMSFWKKVGKFNDILTETFEIENYSELLGSLEIQIVNLSHSFKLPKIVSKFLGFQIFTALRKFIADRLSNETINFFFFVFEFIDFLLVCFPTKFPIISTANKNLMKVNGKLY
jgi:hypothetical protein